jgi:hypothetical protein
MAKLEVDEYLMTGHTAKVYWEGSPGSEVYEGDYEKCKQIVSALNAMDEEDRQAHVCTECGMFLEELHMTYHRQKIFVVENGKARYDWQPYPYNIFECPLCDTELEDDQMERLGIDVGSLGMRR